MLYPKKRVMLGYISVLPQQLTKNMHLYLPVHRNNHPHTGTGSSECTDKAGSEKKKLRKKEEEQNIHFTEEYNLPLFLVFRRRKVLCPAAPPSSLVNLCLWTEFGATGRHLTTEPLKLAEQLENQAFQRTRVAHQTKPATTGSYISGEKKEYLQLKELP